MCRDSGATKLPLGRRVMTLAIAKPIGIVNHMVLDRSPRLDLVFHALAHPARRAIIRQLSGGERNLSELAAPLKMTFPAATKHVRVLEHAKLVRRRVEGRQHFCRLKAGGSIPRGMRCDRNPEGLMVLPPVGK